MYAPLRWKLDKPGRCVFLAQQHAKLGITISLASLRANRRNCLRFPPYQYAQPNIV